MKLVSKALRAASTAALFWFASWSVTATGSAAALRCPEPLERWDQIALYFGRNVDDLTVVSEQAFAVFLNEQVTPLFLDGLSVLNVAGQFLEDSGELVHEPTNLVILLVPDASSVRHDIDTIIDAYKEQFSQESVLQTVEPVCVAF